jgi:hypothetical protein
VIKEKRKWPVSKGAIWICIISLPVVISLVDLLLKKVMFVDFFTNKRYGSAIVVSFLIIISATIMTRFFLREEKHSIAEYVTAWFYYFLLYTVFTGILIWVIDLIWNLSAGS